MKDHVIILKNCLLSISSGSWLGWVWLKGISSFCALILPITGVFSFLLYIVINFKKIIAGLKDIFKK